MWGCPFHVCGVVRSAFCLRVLSLCAPRRRAHLTFPSHSVTHSILHQLGHVLDLPILLTFPSHLVAHSINSPSVALWLFVVVVTCATPTLSVHRNLAIYFHHPGNRERPEHQRFLHCDGHPSFVLGSCEAGLWLLHLTFPSHSVTHSMLH